MEAKLLGVGPDYAGSSDLFSDPRATHWRVILKRDGASLPTEYHMGAAHWVWKRSGTWGKMGERVRYGFGRSLWEEQVFKAEAKAEVPTVEDVLDCLRMDAEGVQNAINFEEWANELGYDTDSRKAETTYRACQDIAGKLARLLGSAYRELFETEPA